MMKNLHLHASGKNDFLKSLKAKFTRMASEIKNNSMLSKEEKENAMKNLQEKYAKERAHANYSLFAIK